MRKFVAVIVSAGVSVFMAASFSGCFPSPYSVGTPDPLYSEFALAWDLANANHASFVLSPEVDWDREFEAWCGQAGSLADRWELYSLITEMLAVLEDGQVMLVRSTGEVTRPYEPGYFENFDQTVWQGYMEDWDYEAAPGGVYGYAIVPEESIGYLCIRDMGSGYDWISFLYMTVEVSTCRGIILDLRTCGGVGDYLSAYYTSGRFVQEALQTAFYRQFRSGPGRLDMAEPQPALVTKQGSWQFSVPVIVLTGRGTDGAGELMTLFLATQDHVTLMGDTTFGAPNVGVGYLLNDTPSDELWLYLPGFVVLDTEMNPISGTGIVPDIPVTVTPEDFASGIDPVLEAALSQFASM